MPDVERTMIGTKMRKLTRRAAEKSRVSGGAREQNEELTEGEGGGEEDVAMEETRFGIRGENVAAVLGLLLLLRNGLAGGGVVVRVLCDGGSGVGEEVRRVVLDEFRLFCVVVVELSFGLEVEVGGGSRVVRWCGEDDEVGGGEGLRLEGDSCVCV